MVLPSPFIAVFNVSSPFAIDLVVPMLSVIAGGVAAAHGVTSRSAQAMEIAHKVTHMVFGQASTLMAEKPSIEFDQCLGQRPSMSGREVSPFNIV